MADKKISALTAASTPLAGTEVLPIVQSGSTVKVSVADLTAGRSITASGAGFGTAAPAGVVEASSNTDGSIFATTYIDSAVGGNFIGRKARGTQTAPTGILSGNILTSLLARGYTSAGAFSGNVGAIAVTAAENFTSTNNGTNITFATTAIGATGRTERMRITSEGEVYIAGTTDQGAYNLQVNGTGVWGAGAYVNGSDRNLKEDVAPLADALDLVNALKPVTFRYKEEYSKDQSTQPGFIAQELQEVLANEVYVGGVVHAGPEHLNVAYQALVPILVKAVQELTARVAELEGK